MAAGGGPGNLGAMAREADDPRLRAEEARLARRAADGDGAAFAVLYDSYEQRIYTFCHRLVGNDADAADASQDAFVKVLQRLPKLGERELNFGAYQFTAARNASYDVIGKRKKAEAVEEIPEYGAQPVYGEQGDRLDLDPERAAMLGALQDQVRAANARLPERQREVLALRELEELSYDEIAAMMGMNRNSVAQLISRARIKLRDELRGSALAGLAAATPDDERAASLIAARMDGELTDEADREWLEEYLRDNERGRAMVECMLEAGTSYRAWLPIVPVVWLREAAMAKAAEAVGADWTEQIEAGRRDAEGQDAGSHGDAEAGTDAGAGAAAGGAAGGAAGSASASGGGRRRAALAGAITGVVLLLVLGGQLVLGGGDTPQPAAVTTTGAAGEDPVSTVVGGAAAPASTTAGKQQQKQAGGKASAAPEGPASPATVAETAGARDVTAGGPAPSASNRRGTSTRPKRTASEKPGSGVKETGSSGAGKQGPGTTPAPSNPAPAPAPAPEPTPSPAPEPQPEPAPQPPPETTPAPSTPTTPTRPCRPSPLRPC